MATLIPTSLNPIRPSCCPPTACAARGTLFRRQQIDPFGRACHCHQYRCACAHRRTPPHAPLPRTMPNLLLSHSLTTRAEAEVLQGHRVHEGDGFVALTQHPPMRLG